MKGLCRCAGVLWGLLWAFLAAAALWGLWAVGTAGPPLPCGICRASLLLAAGLPASAGLWWARSKGPAPPAPEPPETARNDSYAASRLFLELHKELQRT